MKPEDLKYPFINIEQSVYLFDGILFVPEDLDNYTFPNFCAHALFGNTNPIHVEYCSGNGAWVAEKALENPNINWIAVEMKFQRVRKIWSKAKKLKLNNLFIICGQGELVTDSYFPQAGVAEIFINFPDPWPKRRHWKNRIIQKPFLESVQRILVPNGKFTFVTDDPDYSKVLGKELAALPTFTSLHQTGFTSEKPGYGSSYFEELWRSKGKEIRYHEFVKA